MSPSHFALLSIHTLYYRAFVPTGVARNIVANLVHTGSLYMVNRPVGNWKFIKKVIELILSLEGHSYSEEASPAI